MTKKKKQKKQIEITDFRINKCNVCTGGKIDKMACHNCRSDI